MAGCCFSVLVLLLACVVCETWLYYTAKADQGNIEIETVFNTYTDSSFFWQVNFLWCFEHAEISVPRLKYRVFLILARSSVALSLLYYLKIERKIASSDERKEI